MPTTACYSCDREAEFGVLPIRERIGYDRHWRVAHATGTSWPGWLVLMPRRHVMELAGLSPEEASGLGAWLVRLGNAFEAEFGAAKAYVSSFGEAPGFHLHLHVAPRAVDLAPELRGPNSFAALGRTPRTGELTEAERDELAERLAARLAPPEA